MFSNLFLLTCQLACVVEATWKSVAQETLPIGSTNASQGTSNRSHRGPQSLLTHQEGLKKTERGENNEFEVQVVLENQRRGSLSVPMTPGMDLRYLSVLFRAQFSFLCYRIKSTDFACA